MSKQALIILQIITWSGGIGKDDGSVIFFTGALHSVNAFSSCLKILK